MWSWYHPTDLFFLIAVFHSSFTKAIWLQWLQFVLMNEWCNNRLHYNSRIHPLTSLFFPLVNWIRQKNGGNVIENPQSFICFIKIIQKQWITTLPCRIMYDKIKKKIIIILIFFIYFAFLFREEIQPNFLTILSCQYRNN